MNMGSTSRVRLGPIMGTDIDAALDEVYYGRHCRHDGGIPASLGARTSYDIKYAHQRLLKRREAERVELERKAKKLARETREAESRELRIRHQAQAIRQVSIFERRRETAKNEVSLWQNEKEGWKDWWSLIQIASRNPAIQQADYNETGFSADAVRYMLIQAHLKELALEHGFSLDISRSVAAAIFVQGFAAWNLVPRDEFGTFGQ